jgi:hypothetical protein
MSIAELASITAVVGAVVMAIQGVEGWGWLLVVALFLTPSTSGGKS